MATTAMNTYSFSILVKEGIHPPVTMREDGGEVFPGHCVTCQGETWPDVCLPDGTGDSVFGIAGLLENQDIGTVYTDNDEIPVYTTGSGAIVRGYYDGDSGGSCVAGEILVTSARAAAGTVRSLKKSLEDFVADGSAGTILATQILNLYGLVGRAMETFASTGTTTPIKILLSI